MKKVFRRFFGVVLAFLMPVSVVYSSAMALTETQLNMFSQNNILFYDPTDDCVSFGYATGASSYGKLSADQVAFVETYHDIAVMNSVAYGIPWETVMAQGILESAAGTSSFAINRNNFFGIGAFDSNVSNAYTFETPEAGWEWYYKNIQKTSTYRAHGVFSGDTVTDPYAYLVAIKDAGYATDPDYVAKVGAIIAEIESLSAERGWKSSAELAAMYPEWAENAAANSQGMGGDMISSRPVSMCNGGELVSGGMTLEEAQDFMQAYAAEASQPWRRGNLYFDGALIQDGGCDNGTLNNCSAFTQWFMNRYTTLGPDGVTLYQGSMAVQMNLAEHPDLIDGGKVPRVYAIVSMGPYSGVADGWYNHTGIVLGINEANDQIIIGEASCSYSFPPGAHVYSLSKYTNNSSVYGPTYAYTDNVLKGL